MKPAVIYNIISGHVFESFDTMSAAQSVVNKLKKKRKKPTEISNFRVISTADYNNIVFRILITVLSRPHYTEFSIFKSMVRGALPIFVFSVFSGTLFISLSLI